VHSLAMQPCCAGVGRSTLVDDLASANLDV